MSTTLDRLARWVLDSETTALHRWATEHQAMRRRVKAKSAPRRREVKASKEQRAENWQTTKAAVLARANGRCELCAAATYDLDCHHLAPGPMRTKWESPATVVAACRICHHAWHKGAGFALEWSLEAASRIGCPDIVMAALGRRLAKARRGGAA